jgi:hypothetical protein
MHVTGRSVHAESQNRDAQVLIVESEMARRDYDLPHNLADTFCNAEKSNFSREMVEQANSATWADGVFEQDHAIRAQTGYSILSKTSIQGARIFTTESATHASRGPRANRLASDNRLSLHCQRQGSIATVHVPMCWPVNWLRG